MIAEFNDPRLTAIYDTINAYDARTQPDFHAQVAAESGATSIVDLGCGTGLITRELGRRGYRMTGVDPSHAMLDLARQRPDGDRVRWICADAKDMDEYEADLAIMSGHVAQFFVTDEAWHDALIALHRTLRPGGWLSFESRNPGAREWERWTSENRASVVDPVAGKITTWSEALEVRDGVVSYANHYVFSASGDDVVSRAQLRFRTREELNRSLADAGFTVGHVYGDWDRRPATTTSPEYIVIAIR